MQDKVEERQIKKGRNRGEEGQSIVLIALMIVGIIAFVGLATDAGFLFARSSQWSAAVDAAALAGVPDLSIGEAEAEARAEQFLAANGWEFDPNQADGTAIVSDLGIPEFAFTATLPVQTFFLRIIGFQDEIDMTRSATAAYYSLADMPLPTQRDRGFIRVASQFIFGQNTCTNHGDPVSPRLSQPGVGNEFHGITDGTYQYRILVPGDYPSNVGSDVRVQLFDPDPHNNVLAGDTVTTIDPQTGNANTDFRTCPLAPLEFSRSCILKTGDPPVEDHPVWLVRVDEIYEDESCGNQKTTEPSSNTITTWRLYFEDADGEDRTIATYTSNNAPFAATDLKWVTPGVTTDVPTDDGASTFDVNIQDPLGDGTMNPLDEFGNYNIFLDVTAENGTSQNTWDVWAGPPNVADAYGDEDGDSEVNANDRNLYLFQQYALASTRGVEIFALGRMPVSTYRDDGALSLPIGTVESADAGLNLYVSAFDFDEGATGDPFYNPDDPPLHFWFQVFGRPFEEQEWNEAPTCDGSTNCDNRWFRPQKTIQVPINPDPDDPQFSFFGGDLIVNYTPARDEHVWSTLITRGRAFLTE